jgi:L-amino acid N-acyltransferase YncA
VRRAVESDLPAIFAIYDDEVVHGTATFDEEPYSLERRLEWLAQHQAERHPALVADDGEQILAWASLSAWSERCAYARAAEVSVYVDKHCRREGVGHRMLQELIVHARAVELGVLLSRVCTESQSDTAQRARVSSRRNLAKCRQEVRAFARRRHIRAAACVTSESASAYISHR